MARGDMTRLDRNSVTASLNSRRPKDHRKYLPAIEELCRKWPNGTYGLVQIISAPIIEAPRTVEPRTMTTARAHTEAWNRIEVTDIPTGRFGVYNHSPNDDKVNGQKGAASAQVLGKKIEGITKDNMTSRPEYWVSLGRMVFVYDAARCFGCAAAAIYTYCYENRQPNLWLEIVGSSQFDHHFVVVGRENVDITDVENWGDSAFVIDVWESNLSRNTTPAFLRPQDCRYVNDGIGLMAFCSIDPSWRPYLYHYAHELGSFPKGRAVMVA